MTPEQKTAFIQSLAADPKFTAAPLAEQQQNLQTFGISNQDIASALNVPLSTIQSYFAPPAAGTAAAPAAAAPTTAPTTTAPATTAAPTTAAMTVKPATPGVDPLMQFLTANPMATDVQIAQWMQTNKYTPEMAAKATGIPIADVQSRYFTATLPSALPSGTNTQSRIDPALQPYLQMGLQRAQQLFLTGQQPQLFPGQMYVSPSEQTLAALSQQEALARGAQPTLEAAQKAYMSSLGQLGQTAAGGFLQGSPMQQRAIEAATRPITQQFQSQILPGISSGFSRAGRYGSGAMQRAQAAATEAYGRALGDVGTNIAYQDYTRERGLQQQAQLAQSALAQAAPSFFQASFMPAQALGQVGAAREAIAAQPLQEQIQRFQYGQQLPYQQLQGFLSSVYGTPMGQSQAIIPQTQTNPLGQAIGLGTLGYIGGKALQGSLGEYAPLAGAALGGLLGYSGRF